MCTAVCLHLCRFLISPRAARLAILCVSTLQGALIQTRIERSGMPMEAAADELARLLQAELRSRVTRSAGP